MSASTRSASDSLTRSTLADQITERLRRDIIFGTIDAEERLTQESICKRFSTSRIPVRDAIQRLIHDGLIESTTQGLRAVVPTKQDYDDMFLIEGHLHGLAARLMIERASHAELEGLVATNDEMRTAAEAGDYDLVAQVNGRFHRQINRLAKSPQLLRSLRANTPRIDSEYLAHYPEQTSRYLKQHDQFLAAALDGDAELAAQVMRDHVFESSATLHGASVNRAPAKFGGKP